MFVIVTATTGFTGNDIVNLTLGSYDFADNIINNYVNSNPSSSATYVKAIASIVLMNLLLLTSIWSQFTKVIIRYNWSCLFY